jgi:hypothetical protein
MQIAALWQKAVPRRRSQRSPTWLISTLRVASPNKRLAHKKSGGCKSVCRPKRPKLVSLLVRNIWSVSFPKRVLFQGAQVKTLICILYTHGSFMGEALLRSPLSTIFLNPTCILRSLSISDSWERINILCLYLGRACLCFVPSTASKKLDHYAGKQTFQWVLLCIFPGCGQHSSK